MGERGKNDEMKNRRTNFEAAEPDHDKTASDQPQIHDPMARPVNPTHKPEARLGREVQARIGQQLRAMYDDVVNQGVPQRINDLIARLGEQD
jgi:Anti-sigma factor NepR